MRAQIQTGNCHGGNPWDLAQKKGVALSELLDFSADLNPFGPPPQLGRLLQEAAAYLGYYPEPTYREFREAVAQILGLDPACILPGNGTADLIHLISRWKGPARAAVIVPTFTEYERAVKADRGTVVPWTLQIQEDRLTLLFLCNPNNPTGTLLSRDRLLNLLEVCEGRGMTTVVDEATMDLVEEGRRYTISPEVTRFRNLIVLRSFTKGYGVPGLRAGYGVAAPERVEELSRFQPPWAMNLLAAWVGARLVKDQQFLAESRRRLKEARGRMWERLKEIPGAEVSPSQANYFLCRLTSPLVSNEPLAAQLQERGILIRTCDDFTGLEPGRFIRMSVRRDSENDRLLDSLEELLGRGR